MKEKIITALALLLLAILLLTQTNNVISDPLLNQSNVTAGGGNTTRIDMDTQQITAIWQGFYGTVSGGIVLEDATGITFYDWNAIESKGEVFATRYIIADWTSINCTNQTEIYEEETRLNIPNSSSDGINNTFMNITHPNFNVVNRLMTGCRSTLTDNSTDDKVVFWNVLLNTNATTTIYTGIMDQDTIGFNGTAVDYQLLVPVNRTSGVATYNFYLEFD